MGLKGFAVALVILGIGLFFIRQIGLGFLGEFPVVGGIMETVAGFAAMIDLFLIAVLILIIITILAAIVKRGKGEPKPIKEEEAYEGLEKAEEEEEEEEEAEEEEEEKEEIEPKKKKK